MYLTYEKEEEEESHSYLKRDSFFPLKKKSNKNGSREIDVSFSFLNTYFAIFLFLIFPVWIWVLKSILIMSHLSIF